MTTLRKMYGIRMSSSTTSMYVHLKQAYTTGDFAEDDKYFCDVFCEDTLTAENLLLSWGQIVILCPIGSTYEADPTADVTRMYLHARIPTL